MLREICKDCNSSALKSLKICGDSIRQVEDFQIRHIVSGTRKKDWLRCYISELCDSHQKIIKPFILVVVVELKGAFDISDLSNASALLTLVPVSLFALTDKNYGVEELETMHNYYGNPKVGMF